MVQMLQMLQMLQMEQTEQKERICGKKKARVKVGGRAERKNPFRPERLYGQLKNKYHDKTY